MTTGKIVFIGDDEILCSTKFNGDMGLSWYGQDIIPTLAQIDAAWQYMTYISNFNNENFHCEDRTWASIIDVDENELFDMSEGYCDKWLSDYLYIKNNRNEDVTVIDREYKQISIHPNGVLVLAYGIFDEECESNSIKVSAEELSDKIVDICERKGWNVTKCDDGEVELQQYSPAGEDFIFYVTAKNFIHDAKEYAYDYDPDEHAEMWIDSRGTNGIPSRIRELIDDADAIGDMLDDLAKALPDY